jgi:hypothetical protein
VLEPDELGQGRVVALGSSAALSGLSPFLAIKRAEEARMASYAGHADLERTSIEHSTSNIERESRSDLGGGYSRQSPVLSHFDVGRSMFDVRCSMFEKLG